MVHITLKLNSKITEGRGSDSFLIATARIVLHPWGGGFLQKYKVITGSILKKEKKQGATDTAPK